MAATLSIRPDEVIKKLAPSLSEAANRKLRHHRPGSIGTWSTELCEHSADSKPKYNTKAFDERERNAAGCSSAARDTPLAVILPSGPFWADRIELRCRCAGLCPRASIGAPGRSCSRSIPAARGCAGRRSTPLHRYAGLLTELLLHGHLSASGLCHAQTHRLRNAQ